jgi:hypothetical protein
VKLPKSEEDLFSSNVFITIIRWERVANEEPESASARVGRGGRKSRAT